MTPGDPRCAACEYALRAMNNEIRVASLERREGASVAESRATRDGMRELRLEISGWLNSLIEHIDEVRDEVRKGNKRMDALEHTVEQLARRLWSPPSPES